LLARWTRTPPPLGTVTPENAAIADAYARGRRLNQQLRWVEAVPVLEEVVRKQPNLVPPYVDLADALSASGSWQRSRDTALEAVRRAAALPEAVRLAAEVRYSGSIDLWGSVDHSIGTGGTLNQVTGRRAQDLARRLYELEPQNAEAVRIYLQLLDPIPALRLLEQLLNSGSTITEDPRFGLIEAQKAAEIPELTLASAALARSDEKTKGLEARFLQTRANAVRARLAAKQRKFGEALLLGGQVEDFYRREGYRLEEGVAIVRKAKALFASGARDDAFSEGFRALRMLKELGPGPDLVNSSALFSLLLSVTGRPRLAQEALLFSQDAPDTLQQGCPDFLFARAVVSAQTGDLPRAAALAEAALLSYSPSPVNLVELKAWIYTEQDRLDEVDQQLEEWVGRGRESIGPSERTFILLERARLRLAARNPRQASELLRTIPTAERQNIVIHLLLAEAEVARLEGRARAAVELATRALREATHDFTNSYEGLARLELARAYVAAGQPTQAQSLLNQLQGQADREGYVELQLEVRLARFEGSSPMDSRSRHELKQLEADATRSGYLAIARHAREAAAR
jgi:tetratricopeptide (TPR) repeat protein